MDTDQMKCIYIYTYIHIYIYKIKETGRAKLQKKVKFKSCLPLLAQAETILYFSGIIEEVEVKDMLNRTFFISYT